MPAKKKDETPQVEGFTVGDYEGYTMYTCDFCRAGWTTFKPEDAEAHAKTHENEEAQAQTRSEIEADLAARAQVETEVPDEG